MKKYIYTIILTCVIASSCSGFLDEDSKSQMTTDYYDTEKRNV